MNANLTELVFILDRSGSMRGLEKDTVGGFNAMIESQKKDSAGDALVTLLLFDHEVQTVLDRVPLQKVPELTLSDYQVRGTTALMDAVGYAITHVQSIHHYIRPEDIPAHTLFAVTTDGMENASRRYRRDMIQGMIRDREKAGWEFLFIGANMDAVTEAEHLGIRPEQAVSYCADESGTEAVFAGISEAVREMRCCGTASPAAWKKSIHEDNARRKHR